MVIWNGDIIGKQRIVLLSRKFFLCYSLTPLGVIQLSKGYLWQAFRKPKASGRDLSVKLCQCLF